MLRIYKFFTFLFVLSVGGLAANIRLCPCDSLVITGGFVYLMPSVDDTYFVIDSPESRITPIGKRENNDFNFSPGFRVGGSYIFCDCNRSFQAYYTRLKTTESRTVSGDFLWATMGSADLVSSDFQNYEGFAFSGLDLLYQRVDLFWDQQLWSCCGTDINLLAGFEFAYTRFKEDYKYFKTNPGIDGVVNQKSKTWGIGPQLGLTFDYEICQFDCFYPGTLTIASLGSVSLLVSKTREKAFNCFDGLVFQDVSSRHTWRIVPVGHARLGLNYASRFSCFSTSLEVGYEFNTYLRNLTRLAFPDDVAESLCYTEYYNFDIQGLYVEMNVSF